jgi:hypothetical protein
MWLAMIRGLDTPLIFAKATKSLSLTDNVSPLAILAYPAQKRTAMIITIFVKLEPQTTTTLIANTIRGMDITKSTSLIIAASIHDP